jgi:uncharacterized protein (TIGR00106 family)
MPSIDRKAEQTTTTSTVHAEISLIPIRPHIITSTKKAGHVKEVSTSMGHEIAAAFDAISNVKGLKVMLTPMGTQVQSSDLSNILKALQVAHQALKELGVRRIISTVRIDERLDSSHTLEDKVRSVQKRLIRSNRKTN